MNSKEGSVTSLLLVSSALLPIWRLLTLCKSKEQASFARLPDEDNDYQHQIIYCEQNLP